MLTSKFFVISRRGATHGLLAVVFLTSVFLGCTDSKRKGMDSPLVKVSEKSSPENISLLSVDQFARNLALKLRAFDALNAKNPENIRSAKETVINDFIHQAVTELWAKRNKITISSEELEEGVKEIRSGYPDDISFRQALVSENLHFEDWKETLRRTLLSKKVFTKLQSEIAPPTDKEIASYYQGHKSDFYRKAQVRLRQIVVETAEIY
jgi:hypothetical protein